MTKVAHIARTLRFRRIGNKLRSLIRNYKSKKSTVVGFCENQEDAIAECRRVALSKGLRPGMTSVPLVFFVAPRTPNGVRSDSAASGLFNLGNGVLHNDKGCFFYGPNSSNPPLHLDYSNFFYFGTPSVKADYRNPNLKEDDFTRKDKSQKCRIHAKRCTCGPCGVASSHTCGSLQPFDS